MNQKSAETKVAQKSVNKPEQVIHPAVDVFEDGHGITLMADIPGVDKEGLDIHVEGDTLEISGEIALLLPEGIESVHSEIPAVHYQRSFALSKELDSSAIQANLNDGVLVVFIPKRAEVRPRKIQVQVG